MAIDDDLYSRQIGTFGMETMGKISKLKVLIYGLRGSATEIAKNLILMGISEIALVDGDPIVPSDLSTNFFINNESIGLPRATASASKLAQLNPYVKVQAFEFLTKDLVLGSNVVVCSSMPHSIVKELNNECRNNGVGFINLDTFGNIASIFVDYGPGFICRDTNGEEIKSAIISHISNEDDFKVELLPDLINPFEPDDHVIFKEVIGMQGINMLPPFKIKKVSKHSITLYGNTTQLSEYKSGGIVTQVKIPKCIVFKSFEQSILNPSDTGLTCIDMNRFGVPEQLHWIIQAAKQLDVLDESKLYECAQKLNDMAKDQKSVCAVEQIDRKLVKRVISSWNYFLAPVCSFVGGVVAHEVIKYTGKYHPIVQWLYADFTPDSLNNDEITHVPDTERYAGQLGIWGIELNEMLKNSKIFIVGSGALGCEFLKLFSLMGVSSGNGMIYLTDNDRIETSNISRQFFFRQHHVGQSKSVVAASGAKKFNPSLNITPFEIRVCEDSEDTFDDTFWNNLDVVVNALDNVKARQYVDNRCVWLGKPLLESGTLGTMGNVQVVVPHKTQSYSESQDPPEASIPLCTLKHFPYLTEHSIEWARDLFHSQFTLPPRDLQSLSIDTLESKSLNYLNRLYQLATIRSNSNALSSCVSIALNLFNELFYQDIAQLVYSFPIDHKTSDGVDFWSPPKRFPTPIHFDPNDSTAVQFVLHTAILLGNVLKLDTTVLNETFVLENTKNLILPEFKPKRLKLENSNSSNIQTQTSNDELLERDNMIQKLMELNTSKLDLESIEFEKDNDSNHHVDFIHAATLLRCKNYNIEGCDRLKAKMISGKIIPAIATTTSMVAGLVMLEFIKLLQHEKRPIEHFRNAFANLAIPCWILSEPMPPERTTDKDYDVVTGGPVKAYPPNFTRWDKIKVEIDNKTLGALIDYFKDSLKLHIQVLSSGTTCIFNSFIPSHNNRRSQGVAKVVSDVTKKPVIAKYLLLEASCTNLDQIDVIIPSIMYVL